MKYQANGGYQILNFEGVDIENVSSLDYEILSNAIKRQKVLMVVGLVIATTILNCIANASLDETNDVVEIIVGDKKLVVGDDNSVTLTEAVLTPTDKLYFHPIILQGSNANFDTRLSLIIINKKKEAYENFSDLLTDIRSWGLSPARINLSGSIVDKTSSETIIASVMDVGANNIIVYGVTTGGDFNDGEAISASDITTFLDGVNEIYPNL